ncbi:SGNH/GDSL hydrolase family protein [Poriferisphaera sp. WC338]|uniref:SGNH/GDSL hydrolase family protein n=1 Tax=Poriferisphaera sp. WC338 TaxID=3425129 RepID=UPI003D816F0D
MKEIKQKLVNGEPLVWLFYGDSITHGVAHTRGSRDYVEHFEEMLRHDMGRSLDAVINTAISGHTTKELVSQFDIRVQRHRPDIVFLMIGMNDCSADAPQHTPLKDFRKNLYDLAERIAGLGAQLILQTTCPIVRGYAPEREPHYPAYMQAIRDIANEKNLPLIDHTAFWESHDDAYWLEWMNNAFHPNARGHAVMARKLLQDTGFWGTNAFACNIIDSIA